MATSLKSLFAAISQVQQEADLRSHLVPRLAEYFRAKRCNLMFFDQSLPADPWLRRALQAGLSIERNPVVRYITEHHAPVHNAMVASPKVWTTICPRPDHWHVMAGPIVSGGQLVGTVGCTRDKSMSAFDSQDLADMSGLCLHLSVWAATIRGARVEAVPAKIARLTERERQIAELVADGQTNAAIGSQLWITENSVKQALKRMFRKLEISSRAELVAQTHNKLLNKPQ
jgi:DNA-binding CsgD family transcriptional regulator